MKHDFEKWIEEKYYDKTITDNLNNLDSIKNIFDESLKCYKTGAYRAAIIMAMIGFDMIMRDRLLKYKDSIEKSNNDINFTKYDLTDDNKWDINLNDFVINNTKMFNEIFPNKMNWNTDWQNHRIMRNRAAHGKGYKFDYYDVEKFYSWIKQAFNILYPFTALETLLEDLEIFFDISKTPDNKSNEYILNNMIFIIEQKDFEKVFIKLFNLYSGNSDNNTGNRIIDLISELFNIQKNMLIHSIENFIKNELSTDNLDEEDFDTYCIRGSKENFLKKIFYKSYEILVYMNKDRTHYFFHHCDLNIYDCDFFYDKGFIGDSLIMNILEQYNFHIYSIDIDKIKKITSFINGEIYRRCKNLLYSNSFNESNKICNSLPLNLLNEEHIQILIDAYKKNGQVSGANSFNIIKNHIEQNKNKYPNIKIDIE